MAISEARCSVAEGEFIKSLCSSFENQVADMNGDGMRWFDKQEDALRHSDKNDEGLNGVFVLQKFGGRRRFLSTTYPIFQSKYLALSVELCHFYELIRRDKPCRLYFDVDYPQVPPYYTVGSITVDCLIRYVNHCLNVQFGKQCSRSDVVILDSSTNEKFSQHIIYPAVIFRNNTECGYFVKALADAARIKMLGEGDTLFTSGYGYDVDFLFQSGERDGAFLADLGVYTRNRHFRLWRSSKLERNIPLVVAEESKYSIVSAEQIFNDSIVAAPGVPSNSRAILRFEAPERVKPPNSGDSSRPSVTSEATAHPHLYTFVRDHIRSIPEYREATIQNIVEYDHGRWLNLPLRGTFWCQNVGREHRQNRPYFSANLQSGCLYALCHSPGCQGYRSPPIAIPEDILRSLTSRGNITSSQGI